VGRSGFPPDVRLASVLGARSSRGPRWRRAHSIGLASGRVDGRNEESVRAGDVDATSTPVARRRPSAAHSLLLAPARRLDVSGATRDTMTAWTTPPTSPSRPGVLDSAAASPRHGAWSALMLVRRHSRLRNGPSYQLRLPRVRRPLPCSPTSPVCGLVDTALAGREWTPQPAARS